MQKLKAHWLQILTHVGALLPLGILAWDYAQNQLTANPIREITIRTGRSAIVLLLLSLACTPIYSLSGFQPVRRLRRPLGLYAFLYAGLHGLTFVGLDYGFDMDLLPQAILDQRYVLVGLAAGLLLLPLVLTSTKGWQRRLGKNWKQLHRLVYLASVLAVLHFLWSVKDSTEPLRFGATLALLLALRLPPIRRVLSSLRHRIGMRYEKSRIPPFSSESSP
jgi:methionine sulfoxide reductase heme-binding subunit